MGIRGRRPQPVELRILRGNPSKRRLPKHDLKPTTGTSCPASLSPGARREWKRIAPVLTKIGILTELDRASLSCYCEAVNDLEWCAKTIAREGRVIRAGNKTRIPHPAVQIKRQAMQKIREFSAEFGMTPSSRTRIHEIPGSPKSSDEDDYFGPH